MKKQASGLYRTKVVIGHEPTGKPINKWISAKTKKELEQKKAEIIDRYINGNPTNDAITFGDFVKQWYAVKKKPFLRIGTQKMYESVINSRLLPVFRAMPLRSITGMDVQSYINSLSDLSIDRVRSIRMILHAIMEDAANDGLIRTNPVKGTRYEGKQQKEKYLLSPAERSSIEHVCTTHPDGLLLALLYYTGMREGEALALRWRDVSLDDRTISISASMKHDSGVYIGATKTKGSVRDIPIPEALYNVMLRTRDRDPDSLLVHGLTGPTPIDPVQLRIRWSRLMEAAGIGTPGRALHDIHFIPAFTPHTLRHNYATMLYENGVDPYTAAKLLGHSSIKTTMDIYTHFSRPALDAARASLDNIFKVAQK